MRLVHWIAAQPWQHAFVLALLTLVAGKLIYRPIFPEYFQIEHVRAMALAVLLLRLASELPASWQRVRALRSARASPARQLIALVPEDIRGMARFVAAQFRATLLWLLGRPPCTPAPREGAFTFYAKSQYPTVFAIALISGAVEIPIDSMIMGFFEPDPVRRAELQRVIFTGLALVALWLIGDRHWLRNTAHFIERGKLTLRLGARVDATIALSAIAGARLIKGRKELSQAMPAWLRRNGFEPGETVLASPFDLPNVALLLDPSVPVDIRKFKIRRTGVRHVLLFVDDPKALIRALGCDATASRSVPVEPAAALPSPGTSAAVESSIWPR